MCQPKIDKAHFKSKIDKLRDHPDSNVSSFADNAEALLQELITAESQIQKKETPQS